MKVQHSQYLFPISTFGCTLRFSQDTNIINVFFLHDRDKYSSCHDNARVTCYQRISSLFEQSYTRGSYIVVPQFSSPIFLENPQSFLEDIVQNLRENVSVSWRISLKISLGISPTFPRGYLCSLEDITHDFMENISAHWKISPIISRKIRLCFAENITDGRIITQQCHCCCRHYLESQ